MDLFLDYGDDEILMTNITFLDLDQHDWEFSRGARTQRLYTQEGDTVIRDHYTYVYKNDSRDIESLTRQIDWHRNEGSVGLTKNLNTDFTPKKMKWINRAIRQGRIDYLEADAENLRDLADTLPEPQKSQYIAVADSIDALFTHYTVEVDHYIARGTLEFENAVNAESDAQILAVLGIQVLEPNAVFTVGLTVKQAIMYQLKGTIPA